MGLEEDIESGVPREAYVMIEHPFGKSGEITNTFVSGSLNLNKILCSSDNLNFGECNSSKFECSVCNLVEKNIAGSIISLYQIINGKDVALFKGKIESAKESQYRDYIKIIAYDELYYKGSVNVAAWYNDLF